jgi:hypothetical protein
MSKARGGRLWIQQVALADRNLCFFAFLFCIVLALFPLPATGMPRIVF